MNKHPKFIVKFIGVLLEKEVSLGTLNIHFLTDFFNNNFQVDDRISRNLDEIDANRVSFRIIVTNKNNQILASSNSIKPFFIGKKRGD